jgi:hypothetical protein
MKDFEVYLLISSLMIIMFMLLSIRRKAILERQKLVLSALSVLSSEAHSISSPVSKCGGKKYKLPCGCKNKCNGGCRKKYKLPCGCKNKCNGGCRKKYKLPGGCKNKCNGGCRKLKNHLKNITRKMSNCGCNKPKRKSVMHVITSPSPSSVLSAISSITSPTSSTSPKLVIKRRRRRRRPRRKSIDLENSPTIFIRSNSGKYLKVNNKENFMELHFKDPFKLARNKKNVTQQQLNKKNHKNIIQLFSKVASPTVSSVVSPTVSSVVSPTVSIVVSPTVSSVVSPTVSSVVSPTVSSVASSTVSSVVSPTVSSVASSTVSSVVSPTKEKNCNLPNYGLEADPISYRRTKGLVGLKSCSNPTLSKEMGKPFLGHISVHDEPILNNTDDFEDRKFDPYYLGRFKNLNHHLRFKNMASAFSDKFAKQKMKKIVVKKAFPELKDPYAKVPKEMRDLPNSVSMQISDNSKTPNFFKNDDAFDNKVNDAYKLY